MKKVIKVIYVSLFFLIPTLSMAAESGISCKVIQNCEAYNRVECRNFKEYNLDLNAKLILDKEDLVDASTVTLKATSGHNVDLVVATGKGHGLKLNNISVTRENLEGLIDNIEGVWGPKKPGYDQISNLEDAPIDVMYSFEDDSKVRYVYVSCYQKEG